MHFDEALEQQTGDAHRNRAENHRPGEPTVADALAASERGKPVAGHAEHLLAEIPDHGGERAEVHRHVECQSLVVPAHEVWEEDQMSRARNRQELGKPLHDGQDDDLN